MLVLFLVGVVFVQKVVELCSGWCGFGAGCKLFCLLVANDFVLVVSVTLEVVLDGVLLCVGVGLVLDVFDLV